MPECGATTASGATCKCKVREGRCHLHREAPPGSECSVCLSDLTGACKTLPCGHRFHRRCILSWKNRGNHTCPMCRAPFGEPEPEYKVTVTVENLGRRRVYTSNTIPQMLRNMNIITPDATFTEMFIDIQTEESLNAILADLGVIP